MIISHSWVSQHLDDPSVVILDSRSKVAYSYAHIPNSHLLGVEQVVKTNQYGAHLLLQLKIAGYENVKLYDGSFADWAGRRLPVE